MLQNEKNLDKAKWALKIARQRANDGKFFKYAIEAFEGGCLEMGPDKAWELFRKHTGELPYTGKGSDELQMEFIQQWNELIDDKRVENARRWSTAFPLDIEDHGNKSYRTFMSLLGYLNHLRGESTVSIEKAKAIAEHRNIGGDVVKQLVEVFAIPDGFLELIETDPPAKSWEKSYRLTEKFQRIVESTVEKNGEHFGFDSEGITKA